MCGSGAAFSQPNNGNIVSGDLWQRCLLRLESRLRPEDVNTLLRPLQASTSERGLELLAPNEFVREQVGNRFLDDIRQALKDLGGQELAGISVGGGESAPLPGNGQAARRGQRSGGRKWVSNLDPAYTFDSFVPGKSNQIARAAAEQTATSKDTAYNPLLIYGGVGLGKTHLMHGVGHRMLELNPHAKVVFVHAERFVNDLITALRHQKMDEFKTHYRSVDALLIDDIHFFAGKDRSQEEFFHTFNALLENKQRIVLTCDRFPKEVDGLEDRLKSRFSWGLSVSVEPPELETRVAILLAKAEQKGVDLPREVAFFIAQRVRSNVRDLEGALHRLVAAAGFTGQHINVEFAKRTLQDLLAIHDRLVTVDNIQKTVAEYFKIRVADLVGKKRTRSVARPRQMAMALAKELTHHSLPEIGEAFGGKDHTTVMHACRKIRELRETDTRINEDYHNLERTLTR